MKGKITLSQPLHRSFHNNYNKKELNSYGPIKKSNLIIIAVIGLLIALMIRYLFLDFISDDYKYFLKHWVEFFRENGGFAALGQSIGDYNVPYLYFLALFSYIPVNDLYLIKVLSILFDIVLAFAAMKIITSITKRNDLGLITFFAVLLLPTVVVNSAMWGQCDSIYSAFGLLALYFAIKDRPVLSVAMAAIAFSFKLQIVFLLPIYAVFLFTGKIKIRHLFVFPLVYFILFIPAALMGRPIADAILIYTSQVESYSKFLTLNAPSVYAFFDKLTYTTFYSTLGIAAAFAFLLVLLAYLLVRRDSLTLKTIIVAATLISLSVPFLLPSMHERYFYISDVLSIVSAFVCPWLIPVPILVQLGSWTGYHAYLFGGGIGIKMGAVFMLLAIILLTASLIYMIEKNRNKPNSSGFYRSRL
ncbi:MAG: conjugal transfer protein TraL [Eubacteriales bacterium]|jgi:Gpi18-like mannosyltransferase